MDVHEWNIDAGTWDFHRGQHDYSKWFRNALKDDDTAGQIEAVESDRSLGDRASRKGVKEILLSRYTAPE